MVTKNLKQNQKSDKRAQNRREKEAYWAKQINAYRASGLSAKQWCEDNKINVHTLTAWITLLNLQKNKSSETAGEAEPALISVADEINPTEGTPTAESSDDDSLPNLVDDHKEAIIEVPGSSLSESESTHLKPLVVVQHGAITITAQKNYDKAKLMALIDVLLDRNTGDAN